MENVEGLVKTKSVRGTNDHYLDQRIDAVMDESRNKFVEDATQQTVFEYCQKREKKKED